ncbi:hypothetical protein ONZ45_g11833 [Pleurotus djamor]|nr:hypothetical protein ONZ45_g11833 [Pleurotus djamor]
MDYDRWDAVLHYLFRQTQGDAWFRPDEQHISSGVAIRISPGVPDINNPANSIPPEFRIFPYERKELEPFELAVVGLNPEVAVKELLVCVGFKDGFRERGISRSGLLTLEMNMNKVYDLPAEDTSIYVDSNTRIQILDTMLHLPTADKEQCAAFIRDERVLVVWSHSLDAIVPTVQDFEDRLIKLLWRSRPPMPPSAPGSVTGSVSGHSLTDVNSRNSGSRFGVRGSMGKHITPSAYGMDEKDRIGLGINEAARSRDALAPDGKRGKKTVEKRTWYGRKKVVEVDDGLDGLGGDDVEDGKVEKRPAMLYAPVYNGIAAALALLFIGNVRFGSNIVDRAKMDTLARRYSLSLKDVMEIYAPFVSGKTDLGSPVWLDEDTSDAPQGNLNAAHQSASRGSSARSVSQAQATTSNSTPKSLRSHRTAAKKNGFTRFQDVEDDEPSSPIDFGNIKVGPPSSKGTSSNRRATTSGARSKRSRSPSPAHSHNTRLVPSRAKRTHTSQPSPDVEIVIPTSSASNSCRKVKNSGSFDDRLRVMQAEVNRFKEEADEWKERATVAEDEIRTLQGERASLMEQSNFQNDLITYTRRKVKEVNAELTAERVCRLRERDELGLVQELARISAELDPSSISLPTLALWMMRTSAGCLAMDQLLASSTIPDDASEPVTMNRDTFDAARALVLQQHEGVNTWLLAHLPGFQKLVVSDGQEGSVEPTEDRLQRIEDAARVAREELVSARVDNASRIAKEREEKEKELAKKARQEEVLAKIRETHEAEKRAREAQNQLRAEYAALVGELPGSPPSSSIEKVIASLGPAPPQMPAVETQVPGPSALDTPTSHAAVPHQEPE